MAKDIGFMSPEHMNDYVSSRLIEKLKERIMEKETDWIKSGVPENVRKILRNIYELGYFESVSDVAKMMDDIQKVAGTDDAK